mgnify:CR=1 FL=1
MRILLACIAIISLGAFAGCDSDMRESMSVVPDRQGHAATSLDSGSAPASGGSNQPVANKTEMYITLGAQDSLSTVAKAYGVTLEWLIKRNRLTKPVKAGDNLIVPKAK